MRSEEAPVATIDLSEVSRVDSAGLGSIINAHVSCSNHGRRLALVGVPERVQTLFKISRVDEVLAIFPTKQEAQEKLTAQKRLAVAPLGYAGIATAFVAVEATFRRALPLDAAGLLPDARQLNPIATAPFLCRGFLFGFDHAGPPTQSIWRGHAATRGFSSAKLL